MDLSQNAIRPEQKWAGVNLLCTTRQGGVSQPPYDSLNLGLNSGDDIGTVLTNRKILRRLLPAEPVWLKQVHGTHVVDVDELPESSTDQQSPEADASVTSQPGRVLAILTADCLPIVISDVEGTVLGAAHAGWRGLAGGVLEACLEAMRHKAPGATAWRAWIGPGIGPEVFQVGEDVKSAFERKGAEVTGMFRLDPHASGKWLADLSALARWRLATLGVENVEDCRLCTVTDPAHRFFSYRRDGQTGRMATIAWIS